MWFVGPYFPKQRSDQFSVHWKHGVLTTGLPGKSLKVCNLNCLLLLILMTLFNEFVLYKTSERIDEIET